MYNIYIFIYILLCTRLGRKLYEINVYKSFIILLNFIENTRLMETTKVVLNNPSSYFVLFASNRFPKDTTSSILYEYFKKSTETVVH